MRKLICSASSLLLAILLFAGCFSSSTSSAVAASSGVITNTSAPVEQAEVPIWRQLYYEVAQKALDTNAGKLESISLFYVENNFPLMQLQSSSGDESVYQLWRIENNVAQNTYSGEKSFRQVNATTGNPVIYEGNLTGEEDWYYRMSEIVEGKIIPLYGERKDEDGNYAMYSYQEKKFWSWEEEATQLPEIVFSVVETNDRLSIDTSLEVEANDAVLKMYFLGISHFAIPQGSPAWIKTYMEYLHSNFGESADKVGYWEISMMKPELAGSAPILSMRVGDRKYYFYLFKEGMQTMWGTPETGYSFYRDAQGNLVTEYSGGSGDYFQHWYKMEPHGLQWLFSEGEEILGNGNIKEYLYTYKRMISVEDSNDSWRETLREEVFLKFGIQSPLQELESTKVELGQAETWQEIEPILLQAFVAFAKENL